MKKKLNKTKKLLKGMFFFGYDSFSAIHRGFDRK